MLAAPPAGFLDRLKAAAILAAGATAAPGQRRAGRSGARDRHGQAKHPFIASGRPAAATERAAGAFLVAPYPPIGLHFLGHPGASGADRSRRRSTRADVVLPADFGASALTGPAAVQANANLAAKAGAGRSIEGGAIVKGIALAVAWADDSATGGKAQAIRGRRKISRGALDAAPAGQAIDLAASATDLIVLAESGASAAREFHLADVSIDAAAAAVCRWPMRVKSVGRFGRRCQARHRHRPRPHGQGCRHLAGAEHAGRAVAGRGRGRRGRDGGTVRQPLNGAPCTGRQVQDERQHAAAGAAGLLEMTVALDVRPEAVRFFQDAAAVQVPAPAPRGGPPDGAALAQRTAARWTWTSPARSWPRAGYSAERARARPRIVEIAVCNPQPTRAALYPRRDLG